VSIVGPNMDRLSPTVSSTPTILVESMETLLDVQDGRVICRSNRYQGKESGV